MDLYQIKYGYTEGDDLSLREDNYKGFYNVYNDGSVYTGQYRTSNSQELIPSNNFSGDLISSNFFSDRTILNQYKLPYDKHDVRFDTNELVNCATINTKLNYIQENLIYVYSRLFFGATDVPFEYKKVAGIEKNSTIFTWHTARNSTPTNPFSFTFQPFISTNTLSGFSELDKLKRFIVLPPNNTKRNAILAISDTHLVGLTSDHAFTNIGIVLYDNVIDNNSSEKCQSLSDLTFNGRYLYLTDSQINSGGQVFKYDILSYFTGDLAFEYKRFLIKPIGGLGASNNKNKFNGCDILGSKPSSIFVNDSKNKCIKVYDDNFVYKRILKYKINYTVKDIKWRQLNDSVYVLFKTDQNRHILREYKKDYRYIDYNFEDSLYKETDLEFKRIAISQTDSNVFYLVTNTNIYKKFFSNPEKTFAAFAREKYGQDSVFEWKFQTIKWNNINFKWSFGSKNKKINLSDIDIINLNDGRDTLFTLAESQILQFKEKTLYNTALKNTKIPYFRSRDVLLDISENVQTLVFNKELFKIYSNIIQLKNNLKGRFYYKYDKYGDLNYNDYISLLDQEIEKLNVFLNYDTRINDNELVVPQVLNRIFEKIIELEKALFELTEPYIPNFRNIPTIDNVVYID